MSALLIIALLTLTAFLVWEGITWGDDDPNHLRLPDSWEPESSRGRVVVRGGGFLVSGARVCR
jgi:hypothetical protein